VDHGLWEGLTYTEVAARYGAEARERFADFWNSRAHGGESGADLWSRVESAWDDMLVRYDGGRVLVVTHATPIRLLLCSVLDVPLENHWRFRVDPGGITSLDLYPSATIVRTVNEVPPLERSTR
jgi:2,3-bisphosphoglycerate-dependent phosphoglycerate mutase/probable phosphoglycerate mutase